MTKNSATSWNSIEELRDSALVRMVAQQQIVARNFNKNVKAKVFKVGDWVLRKVFQNTQELNAGKLGISWEGPYLVRSSSWKRGLLPNH